MGKHEALTPKAIANRIKAKGLQRLRWYCQMCEKQCRDQNGFKCHCLSESHQRQMAIFAENPKRFLEQFSQEFETTFIATLSRRYGTKQVHANQVYQEIVADRQHLHMNATKWATLSEFVMYLGREGKCKVEETERGWFVQWIDNSPEALARKEAILKKERQEMDDEQLEHRLLKEQIRRARKAEAPASTAEATGLKRDTQQPIRLSLKPKLGAAKPS
ncbi:HsKin17 protein, partial [Linderina pennispora]